MSHRFRIDRLSNSGSRTTKQQIRAISLTLPFRMGSVNCYIVETDSGFVLIDTGASNRRSQLEKELESAGCKPGDLKLIILTHGDFDHTGNAAYLRRQVRRQDRHAP